jgi:hypothetical protein
VEVAFSGSKDFHLALKQSFEEFLNVDQKVAQFLSMFVDDLFRKGLKSKSLDERLDSSLGEVREFEFCDRLVL